MEIRRRSLRLARVLADYLALSISFWLSIYVSLTYEKGSLSRGVGLLFLALCIVWTLSTNITGFYDDFRSRDFGFEMIGVVKNVSMQVLSAILILFFLKEEAVSRFFVAVFTVVLLVGMTVERLTFRGVLEYLRKHGRNLRNIVIVGAGKVGRKFYESIHANPQFGYKALGFLDDKHKPELNGQYLGKISYLEHLIENRKVNDVIVALPSTATNRVEEVIKVCEKYATRVRIIPDYVKFISSRYSVSMFDRFPIISVREEKVNELYWRILKRGFDFGFSLLAFILLFWWLWPLIALAIKISSPGGVFFVQERWGRENKRFRTYKFRSMVCSSTDVDENGKYRQATKDDSRITKVGKFLRKSNLDELPQFWNVLKGEMSIVGPRPHPTPLNIESKNTIPSYMLRHLVKPGVTGWAQVNGFRGETRDPVKMQKRVEHDLCYIENWSFALDLKIIFMTIIQTLKGDPQAY